MRGSLRRVRVRTDAPLGRPMTMTLGHGGAAGSESPPDHRRQKQLTQRPRRRRHMCPTLEDGDDLDYRSIDRHLPDLHHVVDQWGLEAYSTYVASIGHRVRVQLQYSTPPSRLRCPNPTRIGRPAWLLETVIPPPTTLSLATFRTKPVQNR